MQMCEREFKYYAFQNVGWGEERLKSFACWDGVVGPRGGWVVWAGGAASKVAATVESD